MRLFRLPEPLSREAPSKPGVLPPRPSRERDLSAASCARTRIDDPHERSPDPARRRRENYAAAVALSGAIWAALTGTVWAHESSGDANRGKDPDDPCQDCRSHDMNEVGPRHPGVFGREAASLTDYDCSDALKSANIVCNEEMFDKWLTHPQTVAAGAKMFFHLDNLQDRADVIAYLEERAK
jgi:cytochrome c